MDYFSKFLRTAHQPAANTPVDHAQEFHKSWDVIKNTLMHPDERQITKGIQATNIPAQLKLLVDALVRESTRTEEGGTGVCLEYLLKNDVLGTLVRLSEADRPYGIQAEVLRTVQNMVVLMDEQFLVHSAVHRAVLRLLRNCVGDDIQEQLDGKKIMGAARSAIRGQPSEYEEDLVNLLCILCSRIRTYRELLMIFFHDKHWYHTEPLFAVEEEDEDEDEEDEEEDEEDEERYEGGVMKSQLEEVSVSGRETPPKPSRDTPASSLHKKTEYEFLLFNYLLRFVHREGNIGDFARAGLLFLMDVAMSPGELHQTEIEGESPDVPPPDPINDAALALAEYILDGDFSEVLGAGLGAVYSLLPSKLAFYPTTASEASLANEMIIGGIGPETAEKEEEEASKEKARAMGIEDSSNPDFKARLDHFLKLLEFLQDVLRRNITHDTMDASALVGTAIGQSILDAVRRIFLENILYPSILECSDIDGSAVAVMSYIEIIVRTLRPGQLADLFVNFLLSEDNDEIRFRQRPFAMLTLDNGTDFPQTKSAEATNRYNKSNRRKSSAMALLEMEAPESRKQSEYFTSMGRFTLRDLLLSNLKSSSQPTATSALQLLQSMLLQYPHLTANRLLIVIADPNATSFPYPVVSTYPKSTTPERSAGDEYFVYPGTQDSSLDPGSDIAQFPQPETTYSTHEREMGLYLTLVSRVDPSHNDDTFSTGYDHYLHDALFSIQTQAAYQLGDEDSLDIPSRQDFKHRLNVNDPILSVILESLRRFFSNTPVFNIALTGVLASLAIHPDRSLAGWLTFATNDTPILDKSDEDIANFRDEDGDDRSIDFGIERKLANDVDPLPASSMDEKSRPIVHTIFHGLVTQLERYRLTIDKFDQFLLERRQGLLFSENITDALRFALDLTDEPSSITPSAPEPPHQPKPKPKASTPSSFVSFLTPKKSKAAKAAPPPSEPSTPSKRGLDNRAVSSPFGRHYEHTGSIVVEPFLAPIPSLSPWTPANSTSWSTDEDVFTSSGWNNSAKSLSYDGNNDHQDKAEKPANISLSQLLDNVVILEESIKELVAIIHARRSLGIDAIRYL